MINVLLIFEGLKLFFILPLCFISKNCFNFFWNRYYIKELPKNIFNLCVQWLFYKGEKYNLSYEDINVRIFCFIWPLITIISIIINMILI